MYIFDSDEYDHISGNGNVVKQQNGQ
jgi:hypothetical protein